MPFDLIGWSEALPGVGQQPVAAGLIDSFLTPNADLDGMILLPRHRWLLGVFGAAVGTGEEFRMRQTGLKTDHQFYKYQLIANADPAFGYTDLFGRPLPLKPNTTLWADTVNAVSEDTLIGALVGNGKITKAMLDRVTPDGSIHGVSDQLLVANTWTLCAVVWDQIPDQGRYAIVGMRGGVFGAAALNATLMRLVIPGAQTYRPGVPAAYMGADHEEMQGVSNEPWAHWPLMREVSFMDTQMPNIECLSPGANTDENIELLIKRIGSV